MHPVPELGSNFLKLCRELLADRFAQHRELPASGFPADVGETQKVEGLRLTLAPIAPVPGRKTAELDPPRLLREGNGGILNPS